MYLKVFELKDRMIEMASPQGFKEGNERIVCMTSTNSVRLRISRMIIHNRSIKRAPSRGWQSFHSPVNTHAETRNIQGKKIQESAYFPTKM